MGGREENRDRARGRKDQELVQSGGRRTQDKRDHRQGPRSGVWIADDAGQSPSGQQSEGKGGGGEDDLQRIESCVVEEQRQTDMSRGVATARAYI